MKLIIADDHELYRDALSLMLHKHFQVTHCALASSFDELSEVANNGNDWSLFLVDLHMPGLDYSDGIQQLKQHHPQVPIIVITSSDSASDAEQAIEAGALGYILKSMTNDALVQALELMITHGISVHPVVRKTEQSKSALPAFTPRQQEVLNRMCDGASNKRIALDMGLSESTVKIHVRAILNALQVTNRTEAVIKIQTNQNGS